ncbi:uncharacterized protein LOC116164903 [Photinus pyralis]|nr:uncharacterized protein LOC116164903 [Photinus pyralis]
MLRSTLVLNNNVDISSYAKLQAFLKRQSSGYLPKKSKILTTTEVKTFIEKAPDSLYLATKVALIVGISGACRKHELWNLKIDHIQDLGGAVVIRVPDTKTNVQRKFTITGEFYEVFKKYYSLRPSNVESRSFFLNYQKGRCTRQVIGMNKFGGMPKDVATYLQLPDPEKYTGHCFRRTSATMLVDSGADVTMLKRHGGWKSTEVAESYIDDSENNRIAIANKIMNAVIEPVPGPSTSHSVQSVISQNTSASNAPTFNFTNCTNTITINIINKQD